MDPSVPARVTAMGVHAAEPDGLLGVASPLRLERLRDGALIALRLDEPPTDDQLQELLVDGTLPTALTAPDADTVLAIDPASGIPIGAAACRPLADATAGGWIQVRSGWRHRGVGTALVDWLADTARDDGCTWLRAQCSVADLRMLRLIQRLGGVCRPSLTGLSLDLDVPVGASGEGAGVAVGAMLWGIARGGLQPMR